MGAAGLSASKSLPAFPTSPEVLCASAAFSPIFPIHHSQEVTISLFCLLPALRPFSLTEQSVLEMRGSGRSSPTRLRALWSRVCDE